MSTSIKTPLGRVRGLGSAKSGTGHFWAQRVTGVANVFLTVFFLIFVISTVGKGQAGVVSALKSPLNAILMLAFVLSGIWHMRLGMQVIIEDYLHKECVKITALIANTFFAAFAGIACAYAILKIGFGA